MPTQPVSVGSSSLPPPIVSVPSTSATNLLQSIQQPVPLQQQQQAKLTPAASTPAVDAVQRQFSSQISRETADADAQISQLLESLKSVKETAPPSITVPGEKVAELIKCMNIESVTPSPSVTGTISLATSTAASTSDGAPLSGFQTSFLNSLNTGGSGSDAAAPGKMLAVSLPSSPVVVTSAADSTAATSQLAAKSPQTSLPMVMGGASSTQMRSALQNLPPNTRLVRGPNGQMTLQKVQTIELTPDMQQVRRELLRGDNISLIQSFPSFAALKGSTKSGSGAGEEDAKDSARRGRARAVADEAAADPRHWEAGSTDYATAAGGGADTHRDFTPTDQCSKQSGTRSTSKLPFMRLST